jgi:hypothetical protein
MWLWYMMTGMKLVLLPALGRQNDEEAAREWFEEQVWNTTLPAVIGGWPDMTIDVAMHDLARLRNWFSREDFGVDVMGCHFNHLHDTYSVQFCGPKKRLMMLKLKWTS